LITAFSAAARHDTTARLESRELTLRALQFDAAVFGSPPRPLLKRFKLPDAYDYQSRHAALATC
jgi:hypothetical protein